MVISPPQPLDDFPMVSTLIDGETKRWKVDMVKSLFLPFEVEMILNIPLSYNLPEDKIIWVGNKKGDFTVKSAYYIALNVFSSSGREGSGNAPMVILELPCGRKCGISKSHQKLEYSCGKHVKMLFPLCKI